MILYSTVNALVRFATIALVSLNLATYAKSADMPLIIAEHWRSRPGIADTYPEKSLSASQKWPEKSDLTPLPPIPLPNSEETLGRPGVLWHDLPGNPTVYSSDVPKYWCDKAALNLELYANNAKGEVIFVGVSANGDSDTGAIHVNDYFLAPIQVTWDGWQQVRLPRSVFKMVRRQAGWKVEAPPPCGSDPIIGWDHVGGLYMFTKLYGNQPSPQSSFVIGPTTLGNDEANAAPVLELPVRPNQVRTAFGVAFEGDFAPFGPAEAFARWINHDKPEVATNEPITTPFFFAPYFRNERALLGYFPRYEPGYASFTPQGVPVIYARGNLLEYTDQAGKWQLIDLTERLADLAKSVGIKNTVRLANFGVSLGNTVFFGKNGDIYVLGLMTNETKSLQVTYLLHRKSSDLVWKSYRLPSGSATFEKFVGWNSGMHNRPPAILIGQKKHSEGTVSLSLHLPAIKENGELDFGDPILISPEAIGPNTHSGRANQIVTDGDNVYVVYGASVFELDRKNSDYSNGLPSYIRCYDRKARKLSAPVLLGYGGDHAADSHNWPSLAIDGQGYIHVILNGHNSPFVYIHSTKPNDISSWTAPEKVGKGTSYLGLVIGKDGVLYAVARDSEIAYRFDLVLYRKRPGGDWESKHLLAPFRKFYGVWFHDLAIDPVSGRLFLSYMSQSPHISLFADETEMLLYQRPDFSPQSVLRKNKVFENNYDGSVGSGAKYFWYLVPDYESSILSSDDGGESWRLVQTSAFSSPKGCDLDSRLLCKH